ncbi:hypothetical protein E3N88_23931 [Mikania micrantha]|uniref:Integrase catalytic domain-containing protein n=1 Tax=Mikania micrantha TaxID=192012 RepID=A0A5N6NGB2_9ASTR|nr:hypothetical protein E3N88_23931 [Mikania micrantha]
MVERQFNTKLKSVQTDWGGEFRSLSSFFSSLGIIHRLSCPHTSEQNRFVERRHRHVVETGLTLLSQSQVPQRFWHFAFDTAVPRHHGYRCFDPQQDRVYIARHVRFNEEFFPFHLQHSTQPQPPIWNPYVSSYPTPSPAVPISTSPAEHQTAPAVPISTSPADHQTAPTQPTSAPQQPDPPSPTTNQTAPDLTPSAPFFLTPPDSSQSPQPQPPLLYTYSRRNPSTSTPHPSRSRPANHRPNPKQSKPYNATSFHTHPSSESEPTSFTAANNDPHWRNAMAEEYSALQRNGTWSLVPRVPNTNIVDCKWVYKLKRDQTGAVKRYKARLVAKGFRQQPGVDYQETFNLLVKPTTIRVVLSSAVTQHWPLRQLDVQNAFLHGNLQETVYLQQPPGFVDHSKPNHFHRLSTALNALDFRGSTTDPSLFIYSSRGTILYMLIYVDDIILTGNNPTDIDRVVHNLKQTFAVQDMGPLSYFFGIEVIHQGLDIVLSQKKYLLELIERAGLSHSKPVPSPITTTSNLHLNDGPLFEDPVKYRQIVGALQYATMTRPDLTFVVNKVCQFMHSPTTNHWSTVKRILKYLRGTIDCGLLIKHDSPTIVHAYTDSALPSLTAYSDSDWAGCPDDRRSTGGYAIYLGSNLVSWSARKQRTVSRSSTESEYKALADTVAELTWLQANLCELRVSTKKAPTLWCDNLGATYLSANAVFHARTKHVEVDFHFVREKVAQGKLSVQFISTNDQIADVFTKPLPSQRFIFLRSKLQVVPRP